METNVLFIARQLQQRLGAKFVVASLHSHGKGPHSSVRCRLSTASEAKLFDRLGEANLRCDVFPLNGFGSVTVFLVRLLTHCISLSLFQYSCAPPLLPPLLIRERERESEKRKYAEYDKRRLPRSRVHRKTHWLDCHIEGMHVNANANINWLCGCRPIGPLWVRSCAALHRVRAWSVCMYVWMSSMDVAKHTEGGHLARIVCIYIYKCSSRP